jgi:hypothetical protein
MDILAPLKPAKKVASKKRGLTEKQMVQIMTRRKACIDKFRKTLSAKAAPVVNVDAKEKTTAKKVAKKAAKKAAEEPVEMSEKVLVENLLIQEEPPKKPRKKSAKKAAEEPLTQEKPKRRTLKGKKKEMAEEMAEEPPKKPRKKPAKKAAEEPPEMSEKVLVENLLIQEEPPKKPRKKPAKKAAKQPGEEI